MAYRISYLDALQSPRLLAVAETYDQASQVTDRVRQAVPGTADRLVIAEDPLLGVAARVIQPPESLDISGGLPVLYLGGTVYPTRNWQAAASAALATEPAIVVNPHREHPTRGHEEELAQIAWQHRHLWRADLALFWFDTVEQADRVDPLTFLEFGTQFASPLPMAIGVSPAAGCCEQVRTYLGHVAPEKPVYGTLEETVAAAAELIRQGRRDMLHPPYHDDPAASAMSVKLAISRLRHGPGFHCQLREVAIELCCAAGHSLAPDLLANIHTAVDRLRHSADDPLAWAILHDAGPVLDDY